MVMSPPQMKGQKNKKGEEVIVFIEDMTSTA